MTSAGVDQFAKCSAGSQRRPVGEGGGAEVATGLSSGNYPFGDG